LSRRLLPMIPAGLSVVQVLPSPERITILAAPNSESAACPVCGNVSDRVHSCDQRLLADLPWQGRVVGLEVRVRRFRCPVFGCPRRIFAERLPAIEARARRTGRLADIQRAIAYGMGGEPGSRLASRLAMPVSGDTLLRLIRATPIERGPPPRIVGIDDWAWRRGRRYGTLVVDLERNRPIELLPDRQVETVAAWLKANPGITIVARDRAGAYAEAVRVGAPAATEVADRWHLLRNLGDALQRLLDRHHRDLRAAAQAAIASPTRLEATPTPPPQPVRAPPPYLQAMRARRAARQAAFDEVTGLHARGWSLSGIARVTGLDRKTVRAWLQLGRPPAWRKPRRGSAVDPYAEHLRRRWAEGCRNAARLWREIQALGFTGQAGTVRDWLRPLRAANMTASGPAAPWRVPSGRRAARLVIANARELDGAERRFVDALIAGSPVLAQVVELARRFRAMVRQREAEALDGWLTMAELTSLKGFAESLRRDLAAVQAALSSRWSTSPVEGQISRLKTIKRQMYGRAGFELLRHRVLAAA
jgi:transposase